MYKISEQSKENREMKNLQIAMDTTRLLYSNAAESILFALHSMEQKTPCHKVIGESVFGKPESSVIGLPRAPFFSPWSFRFGTSGPLTPFDP